ncbi:hypothetical protein Pint_19803 [Pistacia integerrima]|uniref:Uncharacterized protein n=1 Tax=Pistacia integerrima TaxID=434235 RepID=A0ACC0XAU6_9ROSI|nr:hypothetical protein Pint_19803 [Pistacia integerrima]
MASGFEIFFHRIFIIVFIILSVVSLQSSHKLRVHGLQEVDKVSGEDENEQKEGLIVQKFRALLGLKRFKTQIRPSGDGNSEDVSVSPSPSPLPAIEAETPTPAPPFHVHPHHLSPTLNPIPLRHKIQEETSHKEKVRRVLVPVLVSGGAVFLISSLGLFWFCCKFRKNHKKSARKMSVFAKEGRIKGKSKYVSSQNSTNKVTLNPGLDLFYLNSLGIDLEQQSSCVKKVEDENIISTSSCPLQEREEANQEGNKSESDNASSSSTREIKSVQEDVDSIKYDSDGGNSSSGDKVIPIESSSFDDESFHSFVDSHSSNIRLSNASAGSLSDTAEISSPNVANISQSDQPLPTNCIRNSALNLPKETHQTLSNHKEENLAARSSLDSHENFKPSPAPPPPPLPPPLPPILGLSQLHSFSWSTKLGSKASSSSTLPNLSSPKPLGSSSTSNQTPQGDLLSPRKSSPGIPPPPCPPPLLKPNNSSLKGPPPPPSLLPQFMPTGKDGTPLPKLKPLHWDKVRATPDQSMVWDKLRSSSFELDEEMIESLFGYNIQSSMKSDETKSKTPSPSKHVLEPKRLQNITILSKALNVTAEQVCAALMKGDGLSLQQLEALVRMLPTKEEEDKLSSYKGDINELGSAEKFVKAILSIPFAFQRAEVMLYRETFEDEVVDLRNSFSMLEEACKELRSSRLFLKLLEAVLKTGNRMNVGTIRGGAKAFKLDALLKLADVKGTDGKTTLLHFVVQEIIRSEGIRVSDSIMGKINQRNKTKTVEEREEDYRRMGLDLVSGLSTELYNVKKTATIDLDVLASSVSNLSEGMNKLQHLVQNNLSLDDKSGNFVHSMNAFLMYAKRNIKALQEDESRVMLHVKEITEYFHGNVGKDEANPLRIFVIVRDFLGMLDHVCKELRNLKVPSSPNPLAPFK